MLRDGSNDEYVKAGEPQLSKSSSYENRDRERLASYLWPTRIGAVALLATMLVFSSPLSAEGPVPATPAVVEAQPEQTPSPTEKPATPGPIVESQAYNNEKFAPIASWSQDFLHLPDGPIDPHQWNVLVGPAPANHEAEYYTSNPANLRIENGALVLQAQQESLGGKNYTSARIDTLGKEEFLYGKVEVTAKLPTTVGTWPAVWLLSSDEKYANFPTPPSSNKYYKDGELDMIEAIGSDPNVVYGIAHSLINPDKNKYPGTYFATTTVPDASTAFHTYGMEWTPTNITYTVDGKTYYSVDKKDSYDYRQWPYDQKYYLIVNLALGGSWAGRDVKDFPPDGVDTSKLPQQMSIKSIKYFPLANPAG